MPTAYCVKCKKSVEISAPQTASITGRGGARKCIKGKCPSCGTNVTRITGTK